MKLNIHNVIDNRLLKVCQEAADLKYLLENMQHADVHFSLQNAKFFDPLNGSFHLNPCFCDSSRLRYLLRCELSAVATDKVGDVQANSLLQ